MSNSLPIPSSLPPTLAERRLLNLGCGDKHLPQAVNMDHVASLQPDIVHNLNQYPWPLPNNHFCEILANDVLEHLTDIVAVMEEIHRISQPQAIIKITVPHFSAANAFTDPTHQHYFGYYSFHYFTAENNFPWYSKAKFQRQNSQIIFAPGLVNRVVWRLANRYPTGYEQRWAWIFPAWFLYFELKVIK
jgi:SAM-dependent methyltransferase